jgi:hypothetical protein
MKVCRHRVVTQSMSVMKAHHDFELTQKSITLEILRRDSCAFCDRNGYPYDQKKRERLILSREGVVILLKKF